MAAEARAVGIGIVGAGLMARTYAYAMGELLPEARLVAVTGGSRAEQLARANDCDAEPDVAALARRADVDVVIVASPTFRHREHVAAAAAAGCHVFCETPLAATLADVDAILDACRDAGVVLGAEAASRYRSGMRWAHALLEDGTIGTVRMIRFTNAHPVGGHHGMAPWMADPAAGTFYVDQGVHSNDILRWFAGADANRCVATYGRYVDGPRADESAMVGYTFANGVIAQAWVSDEWPVAPAPRSSEYLVVGSKGLLEVQLRGTLRLNTGSGWETLYEHPEIAIDPPSRAFAYPYADQLRDFLGAIGDGRTPEVDGVTARAAIEMSVAADRSAATGQSVDLPLE